MISDMDLVAIGFCIPIFISFLRMIKTWIRESKETKRLIHEYDWERFWYDYQCKNYFVIDTRKVKVNSINNDDN